MSTDIRMEPTALSIGSAIFEKLPNVTGDFIKSFLVSMLTCMHFYRNNTKTAVIPVQITKSVFSCLANIMIYHGTETLVNAFNTIQKDVFFMILKSEGEKIRHITSPPRDRKYAILAYSRFIVETINVIPNDVLTNLLRALIDC